MAAGAPIKGPAPENIAPIIAFPAGPLASHTTGQAVSADGGISVA